MLRSLGVREVLLQAAPKEYWPRSSVSTLGIVKSPRSPIEVTLCFATRVCVTSRSSFWANMGVARSIGISHKKVQNSQNEFFLSFLCLFVAISYVLPEFVTGGGWLSLLGLVNGAGVSQQVTLTAYKEDGTLWDSPSNPVRILLNGN